MKKSNSLIILLLCFPILSLLGQSKSFLDLPGLDWGGFQNQTIKLGISTPQQINDNFCSLRDIGDWGYGYEYNSRRNTTSLLLNTPIILGPCSPAFTFVDGKLAKIWGECEAGREDHFISKLFSRLGAARFYDSTELGWLDMPATGGELVKGPVQKNSRDNLYLYEWYDNHLCIKITDDFRKSQRNTTIEISHWRKFLKFGDKDRRKDKLQSPRTFLNLYFGN